MLFQPPLPSSYAALTEAEMEERIRAHKRAFGERLVILGHHYQQDEVIQFADFTGDSLKLSQLAAGMKNAEFIVFCGVHFMAESADILSSTGAARAKEPVVILPDLSAGCSMADMAAIDQLEDAWEHLSGVADAKIIPITYVNSSASIKAFCGSHGGACCTSSNARKVLEWGLSQGEKVLFLPDQHLGRNTAYAMGFPLESMVVYDPHQEGGGLRDAQICEAKFVLWKGHCSVHALFTARQVDAARQHDSGCKVIVHPECDWSVVQKADLAGSTEYILHTIENAPSGSRWVVGTEIHLVSRLARRFEGVKSVRSLAGVQCLCTTMYRIDLRHLLWSLDELAAGRIVNQIKVDAATRRDALTALRRMLENTSAVPAAAK